MSATVRDRLSTYLTRDVAVKAAKSLSNGSEIEFRITSPEGDEICTFTKVDGKNVVKTGAASHPQLVFTLSPGALDAIEQDPSTEIGEIGVHIAKLVLSKDEKTKISVQFKAGFLTLFSKGYLGVVTAGGASFASFLASKGLSGMGAIKAALKSMKGNH